MEQAGAWKPAKSLGFELSRDGLKQYRRFLSRNPIDRLCGPSGAGSSRLASGVNARYMVAHEWK
jgi:hypothetical protein